MVEMSVIWYSQTMTNISQLHPVAIDATQAARAQFLADELKSERWSLRLLQDRTGIPKSTLASKLNGSSPILAADIEVFATVLKRDAVDLFRDYLAAGTGKAPTPKGGGLSVPPTGIEPATFGTNVRRFPVERTRSAGAARHPAVVTMIASKQVNA